MKSLHNTIKIAEFLHERYEYHAQKEGWQTQKVCQKNFWELPPENIRTMLYVAQDISEEFNINLIEPCERHDSFC